MTDLEYAETIVSICNHILASPAEVLGGVRRESVEGRRQRALRWIREQG